jgi:uncharacterized protein YndB with AHSA1/START domain
MSKRSGTHATFLIEPSFPVSRARAFAAFATRAAKGRWSVCPEEWEASDLKPDFRVGGKESVRGGPPGPGAFLQCAVPRYCPGPAHCLDL